MYGVVSLVVVLLAISYAQAMMLGGFYDVEVNDANVIEVATWAVGEMGNNLELLEILNAQKQVVAGWIYKLWLRLEMSNGLETTCIVQVWDKLDGTKELKEPYPCTR